MSVDGHILNIKEVYLRIIMSFSVQLPSWLTLQNAVRAVVVLFAMTMHYYFITRRMAAANEEALKVLEDMPEVPASEEAN